MPVGTVIQHRRGTASAWTTANPTLAAAEIGYETDTKKMKLGDGSTAWNTLGYFVPSKTDVGLSNVDNTSDVNKPVSTATQTALNLKLDASQKGATNGVASLDSSGKVPVGQIPSSIGVPAFQPSTFYNAGTQVISPNNDVVSAIASFTSGASYSATNWTLSTTYALTDVLGTASHPVTNYAASRPTGVTSVWWACPTQPTNWAIGDFWLVTS